MSHAHCSIVLFILLTGLAACATPASDTPVPTETPLPGAPFDEVSAALAAADPARGEALFLDEGTGLALACATCHSIDGTIEVGPSVAGLPTRLPAAYDTAAAYVYESIVDPCRFVVEGYSCMMPRNYGGRIDTQALADLIAYIESLP